MPYITAKPNEANILEWHYVLEGPPDTPYFGGQYHGILKFPADYPYAPPSIRMLTPSGRFQPGMRLCLSISDYHPKSWNPAWSVSTILTGLMSFMVSDEHTAGSITTSAETKKQLARASRKFNNTNNSQFKEVFPELVEANRLVLENPEGNTTVTPTPAAATPATAPTTTTPTTTNTTNTSTTPESAKAPAPAPVGSVPAASDPGASRPSGGDNHNNNGMSLSQKIIFVSVLFVSWVIASRMFS